MVGLGSKFSEGNLLYHNVVLKLNYPPKSTILSSLVTGVVESADSVDSMNYFEPISLLGVSKMNYEYTLIEKEIENGFTGFGGEETSPSLGTDRGFCSLIGNKADKFKLEYGSDCNSTNCNPLGGGVEFLPNVMWYKGMDCSNKQRAKFLIGFSNSSFTRYNVPFDPHTTFVAEGAWDGKKRRFCAIACRITNLTRSVANALVDDCSIKFSLRFPAILSVRSRRTVEGQIWSNRSMNGSGYFDKLGFWDSQIKMTGFQGLKYEYSEIDSVKNFCPNNKAAKHKGSVYPNGYTLDMEFYMSVKNSKSESAQGYSLPLFIGDQFYNRGSSSALERYYQSTAPAKLQNISYKMTFTPQPGYKLGGETLSGNRVEISAEGIYDTATGVLCMIGCRQLELNPQKPTKNDSIDCEIHINVQFASLNSKNGDHLKGTIESTRKKLDPLYFDRLELSSNSIYRPQAERTISRMDLEIIMVLISNTLACIFVGLQLYYVKKHSDVLPFTSIVMLIVITLGHMIPLLLNFEALFIARRTRQNVFFDSGGWLEVNEVIVRVVTMIAFLLQVRLLQMTWSSRLGDESKKSFWVVERKVGYISLPIYITGVLIAWLAYEWKASHSLLARSSAMPSVIPNRLLINLTNIPILKPPHSFWGDLKSYGGLVLDWFLLPQILFNFLFNSREKALDSWFYIGTSVVRWLPHGYDLYRAHTSSWNFGLSYIYANPRMDLFSTAWDVIIPCCGLLFVVVIFLQQRFGGRCFLPKRFRESEVYEKVPVVSG